MKRYWSQAVALFGALMVIQSPLWEYARLRPDYNFLVSPWSIRGLETIHGAVFATIGLATFVAVALVAWPRSDRPSISAGIVGYMVVAAIVIAAIFGADTVELNPNVFFGVAFAFILGVIITLGARDFAKRTASFFDSGWGVLTLFLGATIVSYLVLAALLINKEISLSPTLAVGAIFALVGFVTVGQHPRGLAANRMLIGSGLFAWAVITFSAGAIRSTLLRRQFELDGVVAQFRDAQVTSGWFLANIGMFLVFIGAVGMWARRRDTILNALRAQKQREAAEKSEREIEEAAAAQGAVL